MVEKGLLIVFIAATLFAGLSLVGERISARFEDASAAFKSPECQGEETLYECTSFVEG